MIPLAAILAVLSPLQITLVIVVVLLLFGNRIPSMARALGSGIVEFKKGLRGSDDDKNGDDKKLPPKTGAGGGS